LVLDEGLVSYADLDHQVTLRAGSLARDVRAGEIVAVPVHLDLASVIELLALMRAGAVPAPYASVAPAITGIAPAGTALCIETSGSAGAPSIVPISYENLAAAVAASRSRLANGADDLWLATLPFHHIGGISVVLRSLEAGGAAVVSPFSEDTGSVIAETAPTIASLVPTMVYRLLERAPDSLATVGIVLTGGARLSSRVAQTADERGVQLIPTYGMTEATSQIATAIPGSPRSKRDLIGPPLDGFTVSIRTAEGFARPGEVGVIEIEGPAVFGGYLDAPARSGTHRTSDVGFIDADGCLGVIGRTDEVVITGGENVSLSRVAAAIEDLAGVRDVVVVGVPDPEWGTAVCAFIELEPGTSRGDVMDAVSMHLDLHAAPKRLEVGVVPLLSNGKYDRETVHRHFAEQ
jgi:O-succinylbenzoic acid--CoA ligase